MCISGFCLSCLYDITERQLHNNNARGVNIQLHAHQLHINNCWGINCVIIPAPMVLSSHAEGQTRIYLRVPPRLLLYCRTILSCRPLSSSCGSPSAPPFPYCLVGHASKTMSCPWKKGRQIWRLETLGKGHPQILRDLGHLSPLRICWLDAWLSQPLSLCR